MVKVCLKLLSLFAVFFCGCAEKQSDRIGTFPVTGEVYVDGQPAAMLPVTVNRVGGIDPKNPTVSSAMTDENGKFAVSTYEANDGAPVGEYVLTFKWGVINRMSMQYEGDKLKGRYANPETSTIKFKVEEGKPVDMGRIELTTK